jgi:hypothetical protein
MTAPLPAEVSNVEVLDPFSFRWPAAEEHFEGGWAYVLKVRSQTHRVRHGVGRRVVYGRWRVHTVTWLDGEVQVEGVKADDYPSTRALLSGLKRRDRSLVRDLEAVPAEYGRFDLVEHRREIDAKGSRHCVAGVAVGEGEPRMGLPADLRRVTQARDAGVSHLHAQHPPPNGLGGDP